MTSAEQPVGEQHQQPMAYAAPHLDPAEAEAAAAHLDELADLADASRPPRP
ncbi:hypothetical protein [Micromonospora sp. B006]|uniref:hypothetical protein n=1 Tax=Micromonospora sp. B006 TaxID=2201999 RepID=UPI000E3328BC|nr:hypothetical protein [Micromonospora sp. B006]AXO35429.1 hypothetical protein MicB006_3148 [Micromonospora sp. B006]